MDLEIAIRPGRKPDCKKVYELIRELAVFEKAGDQVELSLTQFEADAFGDHPIIEIWMAELDGEAVGAAITYVKYSTWKGRSMHLEDLIVGAAHRGQGIGSKMFEYLMAISDRRGYGRMEWQVLDWNKDAIRFYEKYGTTFLVDWLDCRLTATDLKKFTQQ